VVTVETIDVADVFEVTYPLVNAQQIEIRGADEVDVALVAVKVTANRRYALEGLIHC
jgi:hypothetical protein